MKRRIICIVVLALLLLPLFGCHKDDVPTVTDTYEAELVFGVFEAEKSWFWNTALTFRHRKILLPIPAIIGYSIRKKRKPVIE